MHNSAHKKILPTLLFALCMCFGPSTFALQTKNVKDNGTVWATVSIEGITRISVANDRILHVRGQQGAYFIKYDNNQGAVFIQPTEDYAKKSFTLFIATELNRNYVLQLTPKAQLSDMILLKPTDVVKQRAEHWEKSSSYTQGITNLISAMMNRTPPEGYVHTLVKGKTNSLGGITTFSLKEIYRGVHLEGRVYTVKNKTRYPLTLVENQFYQPGDRAIVLSSLIIPPSAYTLLYKVVCHD
ncbi:hypothetical protein BH10PSE19_BH10PSE19_00160 [soil metagenome]